jgi:F0F1-type ATP synthase assembly protein I
MLTTQSSIKNAAMQMVYWQVLLVVGLALGFLMFAGVHSAWSAFSGGMAYCIPNFIFVRRVFVATGARAAKQFIMRFAMGEVVKLITGAVLFVLLINLLAIATVPALSGYIVAIMGFWIISMLFMLREGSMN